MVSIENSGDPLAPGHTADNPTARDEAVRVELDAHTFSTLLTAVAIVIVLLGIGREVVLGTIGTDTPLQDLRHLGLDAEHSLPAWFASMLMLLASAMLFAIAVVARRREPENRLHWLLLGLFFLPCRSTRRSHSTSCPWRRCATHSV